MRENKSRFSIDFYKGKTSKRTAWNLIYSLKDKNDKNNRSLFNAIYHKIGLLRKLGIDLGEPHVKFFKKTNPKIRELRIKHDTGYHRIMFSVWKNTCVLLNHFVKKSNKTPKNEIELAEKLMDEWIVKKTLM